MFLVCIKLNEIVEYFYLLYFFFFCHNIKSIRRLVSSSSFYHSVKQVNHFKSRNLLKCIWKYFFLLDLYANLDVKFQYTFHQKGIHFRINNKIAAKISSGSLKNCLLCCFYVVLAPFFFFSLTFWSFNSTVFFSLLALSLFHTFSLFFRFIYFHKYSVSVTYCMCIGRASVSPIKWKYLFSRYVNFRFINAKHFQIKKIIGIY